MIWRLVAALTPNPSPSGRGAFPALRAVVSILRQLDSFPVLREGLSRLSLIVPTPIFVGATYHVARGQGMLRERVWGEDELYTMVPCGRPHPPAPFPSGGREPFPQGEGEKGCRELRQTAPAGCFGPGPSLLLPRFVGPGDLINRPYTDCCRGDISCRPQAQHVAEKGLG